MTDFFCYRCNAGPFGTENAEFFRRCDMVHRQCGEHWRHYEKTIQELATEFVEENHGDMQKRIKEFFASAKNDIFEEITTLLQKEVKDEHDNIIQVAITIMSAYTKTPQNLRIIAPSGEGKTYIVSKVSNLFPQDNILTLANATPQAFKYMASKRITEISPGVWQDYDEVVAPIYDEAELIQTKSGISIPKLTPAQKKLINEVEENTYLLLDFTNKTIIFLDNQSFSLWESLKTTLSHDREYNKSLTVNKSSAGKAGTSKIVFKGWPAVIYCSAKDEITQDKTDEINTRFNTISIKGTKEKYRDMLKIKAYGVSLPDSIYQKKIVSNAQIETVKTRIQLIIDQIQLYSDEPRPVVNFYADAISDLFQADAGYRARQLSNLLSNITVITLARSKARPKLVIDSKEYPITTRQDIELANKLTHETNPLPPTKIQFFNRYIRMVYIGSIKQQFTALEICDHINTINPNLRMDRQKLRETYLDPYVNHGYLDADIDPDNKTRYVYSLIPKYREVEAVVETSLIVVSSLDDSCLGVFKEKFLNDDSKLKMIVGSEEVEPTQENLSKLLSGIVVVASDIRHEKQDDEMKINDEKWEGEL